MESINRIYFLIFVPFGILIILKRLFRKNQILENHEALLFENNQYKKTLGPGRYWLKRNSQRIICFDTRKKSFENPGEEVLTKDKVNVKVSSLGSYKINSSLKFYTESQNGLREMEMIFKTLLKKMGSEHSMDELMENKARISEKIIEEARPLLEELGIELKSFSLKDFFLPRDLKRVFSEAIKAKKLGQANLEKARAELATLRALQNAAKLMENNPSLKDLKTLQVAESAGENVGNSLVLGLKGVI